MTLLNVTDPVVDSGAAQLSDEARAWLTAAATTEAALLSKRGARPLPRPLLTAALVRMSTGPGGRAHRLVNRLEVDSNFPFDRVRRIAVGEARAFPYLPGWAYVTVLLFTDQPLMPLMVRCDLASFKTPGTMWCYA